jgi:hypothetical protein
MPPFLFLLRDDGATPRGLAEPAKRALFDKFIAWTEALKRDGQLRGVESLMDDGGHTVRRRGGALVVDGPYAEMKELVTGLFVVEVADLAAAHALAGQCPLIEIGGAVEVRTIAPFPVRP